MNKKQHILATAQHLLRTKGVDAFSFADLAKSAGIQKASVHYYFATKDVLLHALVEQYTGAFWENLTDADGPTDPVARLVSIYRNALSGGDAICLCISLGLTQQSVSAEISAKVQKFHKDIIQWLNERIDPDHAEFVLSTIQGAQILARSMNDIGMYDRAVAPLARALCPNAKEIKQ